MKNRTIVFIFSLLAPGAGQASRGLIGRGAAFALAELFWAAASGPAITALLMPRLTAVSPGFFISIQLLSPAVYLLIALAAAFDAARINATEPPPKFARGAAAMAVFGVLQMVGVPLANRAAVNVLLGGEAAAALAQANAAQAAADRLAKAIESLPQGSFAGETKGDLYFDREKDSFKLRSNYLAEAGPLEGSPEGQEIRIYPGPMDKDLAAGTKTYGQLMEQGLIFLEIKPIPETLRADGGFAAYFSDMMRKTVKEHADWGAKAEAREGLPLPAMLMTMDSPKQIRLYMFGKERYFSFRAYGWSPVLEEMAKSFKEAPAGRKK